MVGETVVVEVDAEDEAITVAESEGVAVDVEMGTEDGAMVTSVADIVGVAVAVTEITSMYRMRMRSPALVARKLLVRANLLRRRLLPSRGTDYSMLDGGLK